MSGVLVVWSKLQADAPLNSAGVPDDRIMVGNAPIKSGIPAIGITQISSVPIVGVDGLVTGHQDRVQVEVVAANFTALRALMPLVLAACPHFRGTINSVKCDAIVPDIEGPVVIDEAVKTTSGTRDFLVRWST